MTAYPSVLVSPLNHFTVPCIWNQYTHSDVHSSWHELQKLNVNHKKDMTEVTEEIRMRWVPCISLNISHWFFSSLTYCTGVRAGGKTALRFKSLLLILYYRVTFCCGDCAAIRLRPCHSHIKLREWGVMTSPWCKG